jgi:SHS2 domain-containing protein
MPYEELEHTADVRVRIRADTLGDLFSDAASAMFRIMFGDCRDTGIVRTISVESSDLESLLADFLSELLFVSNVENLVFCSFSVTIEGMRISADASGEPFDGSRHAGDEIKGISYSGLRIYKENERHVLDVIFDV